MAAHVKSSQGEKLLLVDFGSTFTKVAVVDLGSEEVIAKAASPTTLNNIMGGLDVSLKKLDDEVGIKDCAMKLASSSAAGGLRMVAIGLVPELTLEAAKRAALGAGANLIGTFCYELSQDEIRKIEVINPEIILLCGGTDGGNREVVIHNAEALAASGINAPIIFAGNKTAADACRNILKTRHKEVSIADNVMPRIDEPNVESARAAIREVFIEKIIEAKGLDRARSYVDSFLMPTPAAVLKAAMLLADGCEGEEGWGELVVLDVGGSTTDVHSVGFGHTILGSIQKGLPEPYAKRTVESDLGVRHSAPSLLASVGKAKFEQHLGTSIKDIQEILESLACEPHRISETNEEEAIDLAMASVAVEIGMERHVGVLENFQSAHGEVLVQRGKNLMDADAIIGTGGALIHCREPKVALGKACFDESAPHLLKPRKSKLYLDAQYLFYAIGLISELYPKPALKIAKKYLVEVRGT